MMAQANPVLQELPLDYTLIAEALRIRKEELDTSLPPQKVTTGLFTLPCCITSYQVLKIMKPDFTKVGELCKQLQVGSFHVFTFDTLEEASVYHARNFAPLYGINEDPTTGTANGAVCSYLKKNNLISYHTMICEQGDIIGRPGRVHVEIENHQLRVGGSACIAKEYDMEVEHL
jgi:PhzF family phenazine biosynthesis protein